MKPQMSPAELNEFTRLTRQNLLCELEEVISVVTGNWCECGFCKPAVEPITGQCSVCVRVCVIPLSVQNKFVYKSVVIST